MASDSKLMTDEPVKPALTDANMAGRFLLVPASSELWPAPEGIGGWSGKVVKVDRRAKAVDVQFADGKVRFKMPVVLTWKPLS